MKHIVRTPMIKGALNDNVGLKKSPIHGNGLFALVDIPKNTPLHFTHVYINDGPLSSWVNINPNNLSNHSKKNENCKIVGNPSSGMRPDPQGLWHCNLKELITISDIKAGEELFVDYTKDQETGFEQPEPDWEE